MRFKKKGVSIFEELLKKFDEIVINVRGKKKYVVIDIERYNRLREAELEVAYQEVLRDYKEGNYHSSVEKHLKDIGYVWSLYFTQKYEKKG